MKNHFLKIISIQDWINRNSIEILRISVSIIFLWFGLLKLFEGVSPVQELAISTIRLITFGILSDATIIHCLAITEIIVGCGLLFKIYLRSILNLLYFQILGTFTPLIFFTSRTFTFFPFSLTLEGQYIVKNIVILSAAIVIGANIKNSK